MKLCWVASVPSGLKALTITVLSRLVIWPYWYCASEMSLPLALGLSYGAVMLGGGLSIAVAWVIWRQKRWESLTAWAVYSVLLVASFVTFYFFCIHGQEGHDLERLFATLARDWRRAI